MEIREAEENDIPAIVNLLKKSLGEELMPKSEAYWRWKHINNPFGPSPVLLAVQDENIIGVRAFMNWTWVGASGTIRAVRAVDTATHPDFQGKGIFTTLTKALLVKCESQGVSLVFNTPNSKSLPGYLKMGWQNAGRLPIRFAFRRPVNMLMTRLGAVKNSETHRTVNKPALQILRHIGVEELLVTDRISRKENLFTAHTVHTLRWRYEHVPVEEYFAEGLEGSGRLDALLFFRLKNTTYGRELRIADCFFRDKAAAIRGAKLVRQLAQKYSADYLTVSGLASMSLTGLTLCRTLGPIVTIRQVADDTHHRFLSFAAWTPSLGDLELF